MNHRKQTPLLLAISQGHASLVELLVLKGWHRCSACRSKQIENSASCICTVWRVRSAVIVSAQRIKSNLYLIPHKLSHIHVERLRHCCSPPESAANRWLYRTSHSHCRCCCCGCCDAALNSQTTSGGKRVRITGCRTATRIWAICQLQLTTYLSVRYIQV